LPRRSGADGTRQLLTAVLPVFNEARILPELVSALENAFATLDPPMDYEIIFVNDGSRDGSAEVLDNLAAQRPHVKVVHLSRNFGHQPAVHAGLHYGAGDVFVVMDSDMQDLPSAIPQLLAKWREGYDVVYAVRRKRKENPLKVLLFHLFYRVLNRLSAAYIPPDAGNFGVIDGKVARIIAQFEERDRFYPGLRSWVGFRQTGVEVERGRRYDKEPRVSLWGLFSLAKTAIFSFSTLPLLMFYGLSAISMAVFIGFSAFALYHKFVTGLSIPGWTSTVITACLFGALNSLGIAILGEYIARIYTQVRARPTFIVDRAVNFAPVHDARMTSANE
jgi:dolichol-phosphate mannosyltransferase